MIVGCYKCREGKPHFVLEGNAICRDCRNINGYIIKKKLKLKK